MAQREKARYSVSAPAIRRSSTVPASLIEAILVDRRGRHWIAKEQGTVVCVDHGRTTVLTYSTVHTHIERIYKKLHVSSRAQAMAQHLRH
jgi:hypothetical protein